MINLLNIVNFKYVFIVLPNFFINPTDWQSILTTVCFYFLMEINPLNYFRNLIVIDSLWYLFDGLLTPMFSIYLSNFGSLEDIGISYAFISMTQGFFSLFSDEAADFFGPVKTILIISVFLFFKTLCFVFVTNIYQIFFLQIMGGILYAIQLPAYDAVKAVLAGKKKVVEQFSRYNSAVNFAIGIGALLSGVITLNFGFKALFVLLAFSNLAYGLSITYLVRLDKKV